MFDDVGSFHQGVLHLEQPPLIGLISQEWCLERFKFLNEEADEFYAAAMAGDMVTVVDSLLDTVYVALGTLWMMGLPAETVAASWDAIQRANMRKQRGVGPRGNAIDAIKPPGWTGPEPDIARALGQAIDRPDHDVDRKGPELPGDVP